MIKVGDRFKTKRGEEYVVVEYKNYNKVTVEFCDLYKHRVTTSGDYIKSGQIKNPYFPRLFGVGYFGVGTHKAKGLSTTSSDGFVSLPAYSSWTNMLSRCYDKNYVGPHMYENTIVHEDWHCFQTFADWYTNELRYTGWEDRTCMDKDVLGDSSMYSNKNCCLIPIRINSIVATHNKGKYLTGVCMASNGLYRVIPGYSCSNERFNDEKSAHLAFVEAKCENLKLVTNEYKEFLRPDVYETLMEKDFRYKFSPFFQKEKSLQNLSK